MFSVALIQAVSDWQRGGSATQKAKRGTRLKELASALPEEFRLMPESCYRQIALDKSSVWGLGTQYKLGESISAWTQSLDVARTFKGGVPPAGYQGVIFEIVETDANARVIVNLSRLIDNPDFLAATEEHEKDITGFHNGLGRYKNSQQEIVIEIDTLPLKSLISWGGFSSTAEQLAVQYYGRVPTDLEMESFRKLLELSDHSDGAYWLSRPEVIKRISRKLVGFGKQLQKVSKALTPQA